MAEYENLIVERDEMVLVITINRPPANTVSSGTIMEINKVLDEVEPDPEVRAIIITGAGEYLFSAGADVKEFKSGFSGDAAKELLGKLQQVYTRIENFPKPVIAALNGHALGGGNELAMSCDIIIASDRARIGQPEVNLGIIPGLGGTQRLPRLVGKLKALEMLLTGEQIRAQEALRLGLVNKVVPKGEELNEAKALAKKLAEGSAPIAMALIKQVVNQGLQTTLEEGFKLEAEAILKVGKTADAIEGVVAFMQKRPPKFKGK